MMSIEDTNLGRQFILMSVTIPSHWREILFILFFFSFFKLAYDKYLQGLELKPTF